MVSFMRMTRLASIVMGDPFQPFIYGQSNLPLRVAVDKGISLIMDGENGEAEYGGDPTVEDAKGFDIDGANRYWLSGFPAEYWLEHGFSKQDLMIYSAPPIERIEQGRWSAISSVTIRTGSRRATITTVWRTLIFCLIQTVDPREHFPSMLAWTTG